MNKIIEVQNLSAAFGEKEVLSDVSFSAYENQITIILGSSGCGKTTVMKHLIGLYPVKKGSVSVMGENRIPISEEYENEMQLKMGVLFQNGALLNSLTIGENIAIPLQQHTDLPDSIINDLVRVKLKLVELDDALNLFPSELSGGMRKRAALARAIALDPPLLFCDEPSAGLDPVTLSALDSLILNLRDQLGMTIVLVTHEVSSIFRLADRIVFLDNGKVAYEGDLTSALESGIPAVVDFFAKAKGRN
jgi:phospholipid/cholesterol/gamma-HCH transport system ATP-binding protein